LVPTSAWGTLVDVLSINADAVSTSFNYQTGVLSISEAHTAAEIKMVDGSSTMLPDVLIDLTTVLQTDTSIGGMAAGLFDGGTVTLIDNTGPEDLLLGDMLALNAQEVEITVGSVVFRQIIATGSFRVTGGSLAPNFDVAGDVVSLTFDLSADPPDFLTTSFTGLSKVTLLPTPEPSAMAIMILAIPVVTLLRRRRVYR
jgi:hypothetical protein